ncbi:MAG: hypothetical protein AB7O24_20595 [Kofleriaceae bacterium]
MFTLPAALLACGGGGDDKPDAAIQDAPDIDAPGLPPGCNYAELSDMTNDDVTNMSGTPEVSGLSFSGTTTVFCGKINSDHFNSTNFAVDVDSFTVNLSAGSLVMVTLQGTGIENIGIVTVSLANTNPEMGSATGTASGDHAVATGGLPAGNYTVTVVAANGAAIPADVDYKVKIIADDPDNRCTTATEAANFTEANDGGGNDGNDMVEVRYTNDPEMNRVLTAADDSAEPSNVTVASGMKYRLSGTSANVNAPDSYRDRDTYFFTTGATTTQMSVRVNWTNTADFDYFLFPATSITTGELPDIASGTIIEQDGAIGEFATFAVKPNTSYWLWLGSYDDANVMLPATYDITMCGEVFAP